MATIARNRTKYINKVFEQATHCEVFSLGNNFIGKDCSPQWAKKELMQFGFAKLTDNGPGNFTVHVHGNLWYEIKSPVNL